MKIIRPEQPTKQKAKNEKTQITIANNNEPLEKNYEWKLIDEPQSIEDIMNDVINNGTKNITFTITLTKRQYDLYLKKGGESWIKKALTGQNKKGKKKCK
jgi:hypothetical protein